MADESFILLDVNDSESKKMAQVISNETSRKILDYLADKKEATETEIAEDLKVPLSTVHYNLKQLVKVKLVLNDEYHYSKKGKTIDHYKLANKFVIIAPKATKKEGLGEVLKRFIPVTLIAFTSAVILFVKNLFSSASSMAMNAAPRTLAEQSAPLMAKAVPEATNYAMDTATGVANNVAPTATQYMTPAVGVSRSLPENIALWFFIGAISAIVLQLIVEVIRSKVKKNREKNREKNRKK